MLHFNEQLGMELTDSLDASNEDQEGTFRVGYPYPQAVENEKELMKNSARSTKSYHYKDHFSSSTSTTENKQTSLRTPKQHQPIPPEMSDSLQAELHLSLDRLSENSYDQDDLDRIKTKSHSGKKRSNTYPVLAGMPQATTMEKIKPAAEQIQESKSSLKHQSIQTVQKQVAVASEPQLPNSSKDLPVDPEDDVDDDDDVHTVVVDDSLSLNNDVKAYPVDDVATNTLPADDGLDYLRYKPERREERFRNLPTKEEIAPNSHHFQRQYVDENDPSGGAIVLHNHDLFNDKDSPVRLSADPARLLYMNQQYEEEFNRMLELEHHLQDRIDLNVPAANEESLDELSAKYDSRSKLKPPVSYKTFVVEDPSSHSSPIKSSPAIFETQATDKRPPKQEKPNTENKNKPGSKKEKKSFAPAPPKTQKSNRDYIELNKTRLGRKSNSASYLEMYSKKNTLLDRAKASPRRPLSDVRQKEKRRHSPKRELEADFDSSQNSDLSVEDQWKLQARRLKMAKGGRKMHFADTQRTALTEVGNTSKPSLSPRHFVVGHFPHSQFSPEHASSISPKVSPRHSPKRGTNVSPKSDFSNHPAFSPFSTSNSPVGGPLFDPNRRNYNENNSAKKEIPHRPHHHHSRPFQNEEKPHRYSNPDRELFNYIQESSRIPDAEIAESHGYRYPQKEELQNYYPSSLMQMPQHQYHIQGAPKNPRYPFAPQQNMTPYHQQNYGEDIPDHRRHSEENTNHYRNEMPPFYEQERSKWNADTAVAFQLDPEVESSRLESVPHLPPIPNATKISRRHNDLVRIEKNTILRQNMSDSEVTRGGSYLEQHEKKKSRPNYKRYTLEDYKSLKRDINVGGLGPDLDAAKIKMDKVNRAKKYAEFIRQQHKNNAINVQNKSLEDQENNSGVKLFSVEVKEPFTLGNSEQKRNELQEKRNKALQYARQVPKPKTLVPPMGAPVSESQMSPHPTTENNASQWELLQTLRERHEREKALVAEMTSPRHVT